MNCYPDWMNPIEARIIDIVIASALADGGQIDVRDAYGDGSDPANPMTDPEAIRAEVAATGETLFDFYTKDGKKPFGWVMFVHGNEWGVISDYTTDPGTEAVMKKANDFAVAQVLTLEGATVWMVDGCHPYIPGRNVSLWATKSAAMAEHDRLLAIIDADIEKIGESYDDEKPEDGWVCCMPFSVGG
jgi:hypothetical protein